MVGHREVPGRPALLATTRAFLDHFNLSSLEQLPALSQLQELRPRSPLDEDDDPAAPADLQARVDAMLGEAEELQDSTEGGENPDEVSFRSLLAELDRMEQGLKSDFEDLPASQRPEQTD